MLEWDDLRIFQEAVRSGDYSSAARKLGMNRTTIGRRMARLERAVGNEIWQLTEAGYRPTALGRALLRIATRTEQALGQLDGMLPPPNVIRVAGTAGLADWALTRLKATVPPRLESVPALDGVAALQSRLADLAIVIVRDLPAGLDGRRVGPFEQGRYVGPADNRTALGWSHALMLANPQGWARLNAVDDAPLEVSSYAVLKEAVAADLGSGWLWQVMGDADPRLKRIEARAGGAATADLWVLHRAEPPPSPALLALRDALVDSLQALSSLIPSASMAAR
ncbi:hypothetical protein A7X12_11250 [Sphingomonas sp. TDK1]|nr:hypothetical protein A7X12_11250 [Sphingomonas sp. TDK1]